MYNQNWAANLISAAGCRNCSCILLTQAVSLFHRRRKILKVGEGGGRISNWARKIYEHAHFVSNHAHFCTIEAAIASFSMKKKINCKSNGIDLAAIEVHLLIIRPGKCLEIWVVTILGWRTKEGSAPLPRSPRRSQPSWFLRQWVVL